jgi:hypothetical protein
MSYLSSASTLIAAAAGIALGAFTLQRPGRADPGCRVPSWRFVFQNDANGNDASGSRRQLLDALRRGSPLRVAWGATEPDGRSVVEFADVGFTSLMNGRDLVVQFQPALIQTDYLDPTRAALRRPPLEWHGLMSTDGRFDAVMLDLEGDTVFRRLAQRAPMSWYALAPDPLCDDRSIPELAPTGAIKLDSTPPPSKKGER